MSKTRVWKVGLSYVHKDRKDTEHKWRTNEEVAVLALSIEDAISKAQTDAQQRGHVEVECWSANHLGGRRLVE